MSARRGRSGWLGEALQGYLQRAGWRERLAQASVLDDWPSVVGSQIAAITEPEAITQDGTLFVRVRSAPWMQELQLLTPELIQRLAPARVRRIVWRAGA